MPARTSSHWELGLWRVVGGEVEVSNAQDSNDPRLVATERVYTLHDDTLHYETYMSTTTTETPRRALHLEATLTRVSPGGKGWIDPHREGFAVRPRL